MAKKMKWFDWVAISLLIVGGLNWGFSSIIYGVNAGGSLNNDLITKLVGAMLSSIIFPLVGIVSLYSIFSLIKLGRK